MKSGFFLLAGLLCMVAPGLAQARPRDDVMSGAFRCAAIGDSRQWLDCYYGAAQPVRAELALPPAPAAQVRLTLSPPAGTPTNTGVRDTVMSGAFRCSSVADDRQWLDCYYGAAQPMRGVLGLSPAPQAAMASAGTIAGTLPRAPVPHARGGWFSGMFGDDSGDKVPEQQFGEPRREAASVPANVDHVVSRMKSYSFNHYGIFTVTLANGQVWRQLSGDTDYAHWKKPAGDYVVNISRGWFGSYNFEVKGNPGLFKVQREL